MDMQTDQAGLQADPFATAVVPRPPTGAQGQLFTDAYPTYAETNQVPAVGTGAAGGRPRPHTSRLLRFVVVIVALAVVAAGVALGLVEAGVIANTSSGSPSAPPSAAPPTHHRAPPPLTAPAATQVSTGPTTATYAVDVPAYAVTVTTSTGPSWVSIGASGQHPSFEGILSPNSTHKVVLLGPSAVEVGAGGTKVTVTAGSKSTTLSPPSAPFTYQFQMNHG